MDNQGLQRGNESDEEGNQGGANQNEENIGEGLEEISYEDRVLKALEGIRKALKIDVSDYVGSLKPEELIDWLNKMVHLNLLQKQSLLQQQIIPISWYG